MIQPVIVGDYVVRLLGDAEYPRLETFDGPLQGYHVRPSPGLQILIIERFTTGELRGYWPVFNAVHLDGLTLGEDIQHHPKVALTLLGALVTLLQASQVEGVYLNRLAGDGEDGRVAGVGPLPGVAYRGIIPGREG